jgi:hypothetical protein
MPDIVNKDGLELYKDILLKRSDQQVCGNVSMYGGLPFCGALMIFSNIKPFSKNEIPPNRIKIMLLDP